MRGLFTVAPFPDERGMAGRPWLAASYILPLSRLVSQITMQMIHSVLLLFDFPLPLFGNLRGIFLDDDEKLVSLLSSSLRAKLSEREPSFERWKCWLRTVWSHLRLESSGSIQSWKFPMRVYGIKWIITRTNVKMMEHKQNWNWRMNVNFSPDLD